MTKDNVRVMPLLKLVELLYTLESQEQINVVAYELTCRMYVPFGDVTFDELLIKNGYVPTKNKGEIYGNKNDKSR